MKLVFAALTALGLTMGSAAAASVLTMVGTDQAVAVSVDQGQPPSGQFDVNIDIDADKGSAVWYTSPVWIAIGVVALLAIIALIILATRGGGTTVVKD
jgi:hypothetical protein